jgi:hypothetical protein
VQYPGLARAVNVYVAALCGVPAAHLFKRVFGSSVGYCYGNMVEFYKFCQQLCPRLVVVRF